MLGQRHCVFCGTLRTEPTANHKPDCTYRLAIEHSPHNQFLTEGSTKSNVKRQEPSTIPPAPPAPAPPQRVESHPSIIQTKNQEIVADIRNKLSSAYSFIQLTKEEIPDSMKESLRLQALMNFEYLIERLKEIEG